MARKPRKKKTVDEAQTPVETTTPEQAETSDETTTPVEAKVEVNGVELDSKITADLNESLQKQLEEETSAPIIETSAVQLIDSWKAAVYEVNRPVGEKPTNARPHITVVNPIDGLHFMGFPVILDETVPPGEVVVQGNNGKTVRLRFY